MKRIQSTMPWFLQALALAVVCWLVVQFPGQDETIAQAAPQAIGEAPSVSPVLPDDIPGGAPNADQTEAAIFAWKEFIALNWPAVEQTGAVGTRGKADATIEFGQKSRLFRVLSGRRSQIEFPTVEVDGVDEVLLIAETARRGLDPLNP